MHPEGQKEDAQHTSTCARAYTHTRVNTYNLGSVRPDSKVPSYLIYLNNKFILRACSVPSTVLGARGTAMNNTDRVPTMGTYDFHGRLPP